MLRLSFPPSELVALYNALRTAVVVYETVPFRSLDTYSSTGRISDKMTMLWRILFGKLLQGTFVLEAGRLSTHLRAGLNASIHTILDTIVAIKLSAQTEAKSGAFESLPLSLPPSLFSTLAPVSFGLLDASAASLPISNPGNTLTEFHFFTKLPQELRLQIWEMAMPPRVVAFLPGGGKPPAVLQANQESRYHAFRSINGLVHINCERNQWWGLPDFSVYVDYEIDIIWLGKLHAWIARDRNQKPSVYYGESSHSLESSQAAFGPSWTEPVKSLAINLEELSIRSRRSISIDKNWIKIWKYLSDWFTNLEKVYIILEDARGPDAPYEDLVEVDRFKCSDQQQLHLDHVFAALIDARFPQSVDDVVWWWWTKDPEVHIMRRRMIADDFMSKLSLED